MRMRSEVRQCSDQNPIAPAVPERLDFLMFASNKTAALLRLKKVADLLTSCKHTKTIERETCHEKGMQLADPFVSL